MKTAKEIEKLAFDTILSEQGKLGFVVGYNCCQKDISHYDKKFTEEDLREAIEKAIYLKGGFDKEGFSFYKDDNEIKEEIINSLNTRQ